MYNIKKSVSIWKVYKTHQATYMLEIGYVPSMETEYHTTITVDNIVL